MFIRKTEKVIHHKAKDLFDLILAVDRYPDFLPWCSAARILEKNDNYLIADLVVSFTGFRERYRSKVNIIYPSDSNNFTHEVIVEMIEGPFDRLHNHWKITKITEDSCKVDFEIAFSFNSTILNKIISIVFEKAFAKMVEAFEKRADEVYS